MSLSRLQNFMRNFNRHVLPIERMVGALYLELLGPRPPSLAPATIAPLPAPEASSADQDFTWEGLLLWAVPKKRTSHSKKRMRSRHKYLQCRCDYTVCPQCKNLKLLHVLCAYCLKETLKATAEMRRAELQVKVQQVVDRVRER